MPAPGQFLPRKSGAHRIACKALYKALLIQCPKIPLPDDIEYTKHVNPIKHFIRKRFQRSKNDVSPNLVVPALKVGYAAEEFLRAAAAGHSPSITQIHSILHELHARSSHSRAIAQPMPPRPPTPAPYPNAPKVLEIRPLPLKKLSSGVRHVPSLSYADYLPFLRFKKPMSPFLSRVLRQKLQTKQKRRDDLDQLEYQTTEGENEEAWEHNLRFPFGMDEVRGQEGVDGKALRRMDAPREKWDREGKEILRSEFFDGETPWHLQSALRRKELKRLMSRDVNRAQELSVKMLKVMDQEKELWSVEREERRRAKKEERRVRKEERERLAARERASGRGESTNGALQKESR